jgi:hypothetical protein
MLQYRVFWRNARSPGYWMELHILIWSVAEVNIDDRQNNAIITCLRLRDDENILSRDVGIKVGSSDNRAQLTIAIPHNPSSLCRPLVLANPTEELLGRSRWQRQHLQPRLDPV